MAPSTKPSVQTRLVLEAMAAVETKADERWERVFQSLERLSKKLEAVDVVQQQLLGQADLAASVAEKAAEERTRMARQIEETGKAVATLRLQNMGRDLDSDNAGRGDPGHIHRRGRTGEGARAGGSSRGLSSERRTEEAGWGDAERDQKNHALPKLSFPKFQGLEPGIWLAKCMDYFTIYRVPEMMWVTAASMHMEGNAARWLQVYRVKKGLGD
jgi:hypothetical protein